MDSVKVENGEGEEGGYDTSYGEGGPEEAIRQLVRPSSFWRGVELA